MVAAKKVQLLADKVLTVGWSLISKYTSPFRGPGSVVCFDFMLFLSFMSSCHFIVKLYYTQ
jgi:hypothetical protein